MVCRDAQGEDQGKYNNINILYVDIHVVPQALRGF